MIFDPFPFDEDESADDLEASLEAISPSTLVAFIAVAGLVQFGLLVGSIGIMLVTFRGQWTIGGVLIGSGVGALLLAYVSYRRYRARQ